LVGGIGVVVISFAIGGHVVGSSHALVAAQAEEARRLVAATPLLVVLGLAHFLAALALLRGRDLSRIAAVLVTGLAALAAAVSAAMFSAGVDPFGPGRAHASTSSIGLLMLAAFLYGIAAVAAGSGPADD
jgi:hypothetical protein